MMPSNVVLVVEDEPLIPIDAMQSSGAMTARREDLAEGGQRIPKPDRGDRVATVIELPA